MSKTAIDLEQQYVQRFKDLYMQLHGRQLTNAEALAHFRSLVALVRSVYKPISLSKAQELQRLLSKHKIINTKSR